MLRSWLPNIQMPGEDLTTQTPPRERITVDASTERRMGAATTSINMSKALKWYFAGNYRSDWFLKKASMKCMDMRIER